MDVHAAEAALHEPAPARAGTAVHTGAHLLLGLLVLTLSTLIAGRAYGFAVAASQPWWLERLPAAGALMHVVEARQADRVALATAVVAATITWIACALVCLRLLISRRTWISVLTLEPW